MQQLLCVLVMNCTACGNLANDIHDTELYMNQLLLKCKLQPLESDALLIILFHLVLLHTK